MEKGKRSRSRALRGYAANKIGHLFEEHFLRTARTERISAIQIPDSCKPITKEKWARVDSPFDFVLALNGQGGFFDTKTFDKERISHSDIKQCQLANLTVMGQNAIAGYVIWFRKGHRVVFFPWYMLLELEPKQGYHREDGLDLGPVTNFSIKHLFKSEEGRYGDRVAKSTSLWGTLRCRSFNPDDSRN